MNELLSVMKEWLPVIKDIVFMGAAFIAGYVGLRGLSTWRRQLKGKTEYELAKQLLRSVYELREAIAGVRNPLMRYSSEPDMPEEKRKELSQREKQWHAMFQAYEERWEPLRKAKPILDTHLLEAEVVWGNKIVEKIKPLNGLIRELFRAIEDHLEAMNPNVDYVRPSAEEIKKRSEILYGGGAVEQDEYRKRLEEVITTIEEELKPHVVQYHR